MGKVAIYGFGRIGRSLLRAALRRDLFVPSVIADIGEARMLAALFEVDTNYGRWPERVAVGQDRIEIGDRKIDYVNSKEQLPKWSDLGVDVVVDCTGRAVTRIGAQPHIANGARHVIVSAPSKTLQDCDAVLLPGINLDTFDPERHRIISMASCTTNALAPIVKVLLENFGIRFGLFSTVHAYTNTQSLTDQPMRDRRDSWAAAENIVPAFSGASKALQFIWNDLKITGKAYRVPVRTGSIVELNVVTERPVTVDAVNRAFSEAAGQSPLRGILAVLTEEWASSRIVGEQHSSLVDLPLTQVPDERFVSVASWYDNEEGYATRLAETVSRIAGTA